MVGAKNMHSSSGCAVNKRTRLLDGENSLLELELSGCSKIPSANDITSKDIDSVECRAIVVVIKVAHQP